MITLTEAHSNYFRAHEQLAKLKLDFDKKQSELNAEIIRNQNIIKLASVSIDTLKVQLAETILYATKYTGEGDQPSCVSDAIKQFSTGKPIREEYSDLWVTTFSTKNYDRWSSQRCDCSYYSCPRHGWINFEIGLKREFRDSKRTHSDLTPDEIEAVVYYLTNLVNIQKIKNN
jgi:hypothetical protein